MRENIEYKRFLGQRTRELRKHRGFTQAGLAERLGVTQEYLGKIERGLASPSFPLLLDLAGSLGVEPGSLLGSGPTPEGGLAPAAESLTLREIRHRMRNGFQFLSGLVSLEMQRAESDAVLRVLRDLAARIRCLLLVDECLCGEDGGRPLDLGEQLRKIWTAVSGIYPTPRITAEFQVEPIEVVSATARACGLVFTEFLTNMYKHAFPGRATGILRLGLSRNGETVRMQVSDNGVGIPSTHLAGRPGSMGVALMRGYAEHQLRGVMHLENRGGTVLTVQFPLSPA